MYMAYSSLRKFLCVFNICDSFLLTLLYASLCIRSVLGIKKDLCFCSVFALRIKQSVQGHCCLIHVTLLTADTWGSLAGGQDTQWSRPGQGIVLVPDLCSVSLLTLTGDDIVMVRTG
jgi:hypothetical protein